MTKALTGHQYYSFNSLLYKRVSMQFIHFDTSVPKIKILSVIMTCINFLLTCEKGNTPTFKMFQH